jgi:hypothetical protein
MKTTKTRKRADRRNKSRLGGLFNRPGSGAASAAQLAPDTSSRSIFRIAVQDGPPDRAGSGTPSTWEVKISHLTQVQPKVSAANKHGDL